MLYRKDNCRFGKVTSKKKFKKTSFQLFHDESYTYIHFYVFGCTFAPIELRGCVWPNFWEKGTRPISCTSIFKCYENPFLQMRSIAVNFVLLFSLADNKPFRCKLCPMSFKRSDSLQLHSKIHSASTANATFVCEICQYKTISRNR